MKKYTVDILNDNDFTNYLNDLEKLVKMYETQEFKEFILQKAKDLLDSICAMNLPIPNEYGNDINEYLSPDHMKSEIKGDEIILYNDSEIDIGAKNMKETTKAKYPSKLSLAEIIEYGIGAEGQSSAYPAEDWQYDVNNHGGNGWYYKTDDGEIHWTTGFSGRFIFYKLSEQIKYYLGSWIEEYINNKN